MNVLNSVETLTKPPELCQPDQKSVLFVHEHLFMQTSQPPNPFYSTCVEGSITEYNHPPFQKEEQEAGNTLSLLGIESG